MMFSEVFFMANELTQLMVSEFPPELVSKSGGMKIGEMQQNNTAAEVVKKQKN